MFAWSCWLGCTQSFWSMLCLHGAAGVAALRVSGVLCLYGAAGVAALRVSGVCYVCMELLAWLHSEFLECVMCAWSYWCGCTQSFWSMLCLHGAAGVAALRVSVVCYVCMELLVWLHSEFL